MEREHVGKPSVNFAVKKHRGELYDIGAVPDRNRPPKHRPALKSTLCPASISLHLRPAPPGMCLTVIKTKRLTENNRTSPHFEIQMMYSLLNPLKLDYLFG